MIRPFSFQDLNSILRIERQSFPKSPYAWSTFLQLHSFYPDTFWVYAKPSPGKKEEEIWGYIIFTPGGHIISIAVHPLVRRKGIGTQLLRRAMKTPHLKKLWAEVRRSNQNALAFYAGMGFCNTDTVPNYYGNEDALIIQLKLPVSPAKSVKGLQC